MTSRPPIPQVPHLRGETLGQPLSEREREALVRYARLANWAKVAREMGVSDYTIKNFMSRAYAKLGVQSAVAAYRELGWLRVAA